MCVLSVLPRCDLPVVPRRAVSWKMGRDVQNRWGEDFEAINCPTQLLQDVGPAYGQAAVGRRDERWRPCLVAEVGGGWKRRGKRGGTTHAGCRPEDFAMCNDRSGCMMTARNQSQSSL